MNREELFKRTRDLLKPEEARRWTVLAIGAGSGNSRSIEEVVRFGTGTVLLVDRPEERLEEHNIIRHSLGYSSLGRLKIEALRDRLLDIHPECRVEVHGLDVTAAANREELADLIRRADLVLLGTDTEDSKHVMNELCVRAAVPLVFAGVFDGGVGGEVGRVLPGEACYACIASQVNPGSEVPRAQRPDLDYTSSTQPEHGVTAALNLDIAMIALIQARLALMTLRRKTSPQDDLGGNYLCFGNRALPGLFARPFENWVWTLPRRATCLICSHAAAGEGAADDVEAKAARILQSACGSGTP